MDSQPLLTQHFTVKYPSPAFGGRSTHWNWKGQGELIFTGDEITLTGKRRRPFWFACPQTITIQRDQVRDVVQKGSDLACVVDLERRTPEPLILKFDSSVDAEAAAALMPVTRSLQHQEFLAFAEELDKSGTRARVTPVLIATCVAVFVLLAVCGISIIAPDGGAMIHWGTNFGPLTLTRDPWRLFTAMFLHFGLLHIALNIWSLWSLGCLVERLLGSVRFTALYLLSGLGGSWASVFWNPDVNSAGASGAIFGVIGALLAMMLNPTSRIPPTVARAQRNSSLAFIAFNVFNGLAHQGIDNAAHLGGLTTGFILGWLLAVPLGSVPPKGFDRRLAGTAAVAILTLGGLMTWLMHPRPEEAERRMLVMELEAFFDQEAQALTKMDELEKQFNAKRLSELQWAQRSLSEVLPLWKGVNETVQSMKKKATSANRSPVDTLETYAQMRVLQTDVRTEAILRKGNAREWTDAQERALAYYIKEAQDAVRKLEQ